MNDLIDFKKLKFLWKLIKLHTFPTNYLSKIQNRFFIKNHSKFHTLFRLTLYFCSMNQPVSSFPLVYSDIRELIYLKHYFDLRFSVNSFFIRGIFFLPFFFSWKLTAFSLVAGSWFHSWFTVTWHVIKMRYHTFCKSILGSIATRNRAAPPCAPSSPRSC